MPWFVNWNDYRGNFEAEASRILGHRVHVSGSAHATIFPSPSLTFTGVEVADDSGATIMTVEKFDVVIELMPLLQGEIRVVSMTLEKPDINVAIDASGKAAWLNRAKAPEPLDPDKIALDSVSIKDGSLHYEDARTGVAMAFSGISADISARSLSGPWHVDGFYLDNGNQVEFRASTGRVLDDGTIRVKADFGPARWPVTVGVDGPVGIDPVDGLTYRGTYVLNEVVAGDAGSGGWRSQGAFALTGSRLEISKAVLSNGPVERAFSVAGALSVNFGLSPSFSATAEARQIDLDRSLGKGPSEPVDVSVAADNLVDTLSHLPVPAMPGTIKFNVPAIVVGGRVIEGVAFTAEPARGGWQIDNLTAGLPGQARLDASGVLSTEAKFGFVGQAHLAVNQPATFATWWRGSEQEGSGRLLAPFDLSGHADIALGRVAVDHVNARIGDATITGSFAWGDTRGGGQRELGTDLKADRIDFVQLRALTEILAGHNLSGTTALADKYAIRVSAGSFDFGDLQLRDVAIDAAYSDDVLTVVKLAIGDVGGASFRVNSGRIQSLTSSPRGHLDATLDAPKLDGLTRIAERFLPDSGFARWLRAASPALGEAVVTAKISAPPANATSGFAFTVENGVAASTTFNLSLKSSGGLGDWRSKPAQLAATLDSPDSAGLARQLGMTAVPLASDNGAHVEVHGDGVPADGLETVIVTDFAGLVANLSGKLAVADDLSPSFTGKVGLSSANIDPIIAMAGLGIPGAAIGTALELDGQLVASANAITLDWKSGKVGTAIAGGKVTLGSDGARGWRIGGNIVADDVDLGWLASLGLGFAPMPTGDPATPWSRTPFISPVYGQVSGTLDVAADRLDVGDLGLTGTKFAIALQPQRIDLDLTAGHIAGGAVTGGMSIHNVGGNANLSGRFDLKGAALESFVWQRDGRSVATGGLDLSANFEATGRSPAGLVSTMTGGGVIAVHDGTARYVNPNAVRQLVRASDLGQQYSEDALKISFGERIDADDLSFGETSGAFAIVAGAVRLKNLAVKTDGLAATGNAVVDFNTMTLDSDWSLTFDPVDNKVEGVEPKAGIVFRGPLTSPSRTLDVLPFAAYLNEREAARMNEIIALDLATRAEKERLARFARRLAEDADRRAEEARLAAEAESQRHEAEVAKAVALETLHVNREVGVEQIQVAALMALADRLAAEQKAAEASAAQAAGAAKAARAKADAAEKALAAAVAADQTAAAAADATASELVAAQSAADAASADAATLGADADAARQALAAAATAEAAAKAAAATAAKDKADAEAALKAASTRAATAANAATKAEAAASVAAADKANADKALADAVAAREAARTALAAAEAAVAAAQAESTDAASSDTTLGNAVAREQQAKDQADAAADAAKTNLDAAMSDLESARAARDAANAKVASAKTEADAAAARAKAAADLAANAGADADAAKQAQDLADRFAGQAATRKAAVDEAAAGAAEAQAMFDQVEGAAKAAADKAASAADVATAAATALDAAVAKADKAANARSAAVSDLSRAVAARDSAAAALTEKQAAADAAASAAESATAGVAKTADAAKAARAAANSALADKAVAEQKAAELATAATSAAGTLQAATADRVAADATARAAVAKSSSAASASTAASRGLAAKKNANDAAQAAAAAARAAKLMAEASAADARTMANAAEVNAQSAAANAEAAAAAAASARQTAERAAAAAVPSGAVEVSAPPPPVRQGATIAPVNAAAVAAEPVVVTPQPAPRPRRTPLSIVPDVQPANRPLSIVPRQ